MTYATYQWNRHNERWTLVNVSVHEQHMYNTIKDITTNDPNVEYVLWNVTQKEIMDTNTNRDFDL